MGLKELYTTASAAVGKLDARVEKVESKGGGGDSQTSLLHYKNMTVNVLDKMDQWRNWKSDVEDYTEETLPGIRGYLEKTQENVEEIEEVDVDPVAWEQRGMLWRFLKKYTAGDARKIVSSVSDRNGWEAWRKLHLQFEPALGMREAVRNGSG